MKGHRLRKHYLGLPFAWRVILHILLIAVIICIPMLYDTFHPFREPPAWLMLLFIGLIIAESLMLHWSL